MGLAGQPDKRHVPERAASPGPHVVRDTVHGGIRDAPQLRSHAGAWIADRHARGRQPAGDRAGHRRLAASHIRDHHRQFACAFRELFRRRLAGEQREYRRALLPVAPEGRHVPRPSLHDQGHNLRVRYLVTATCDADHDVYGAVLRQQAHGACRRGQQPLPLTDLLEPVQPPLRTCRQRPPRLQAVRRIVGFPRNAGHVRGRLHRPKHARPGARRRGQPHVPAPAV